MLQWIKDERLKIFGDMVGEEYALSPLAPIPDALPTDPAKVALGYKLFHDVRLSTDNTVSCASCHSLEKPGRTTCPLPPESAARKAASMPPPFSMPLSMPSNFGTDAQPTSRNRPADHP